MKITIDSDKCIGSGNCENAANAVFALGDDGLARVIDNDPDAGLARRVKGAALGCPTGAITITED